MKQTVRIGNGAGFWGDTLDAPRLLAEAGQLDYLTLEYLAELTLSILAHQKSRNPQMGYATDFPDAVASLLPALRAQPELKIVTNAGGMNPHACARKVAEVLAGTDAGARNTADSAPYVAAMAAGDRVAAARVFLGMWGEVAEARAVLVTASLAQAPHTKRQRLSPAQGLARQGAGKPSAWPTGQRQRRRVPTSQRRGTNRRSTIRVR